MNPGPSKSIQDSRLTRNSKMKFWQLNCNSLNKSKLVEFKKILMDENPTIVCLQETWWHSPIITNFKGYEIARIDRENTGSQQSKGGGVAILINENHFQITEILDVSDNMINLEVVIVKCVRTDGAAYTVANIYNSNGQNTIKNDLDFIYQKMEGTKILCGDLNGHSILWESDGRQNRSGKDITNFAYDVSDLALITPADTVTYMNIQTNYSSTIDLTFASCQIMQVAEYKTRVDLDIGSPHSLIQISFDLLPEKEMQYYKKRKFNQVEISHICKKLEENLPEKLKCLETDTKSFMSIMESAIKEISANCQRKLKKVHLHGWNDEIQKLVQERRKAKRYLQRQFSTQLYIQYKELDAKVKNRIMNLKRDTWRKFCESKLNKDTPY